MNHWKIYLSLLICGVSLGISQQAQRSDDFVASLGTNTHLSWIDTCTYYDDYPHFKSYLVDSGIRRFRESMLTGWDLMYTRLQDLGASGLKGQFIVAPGTDVNFVKTYPDLVGDVFERYELPNEYDSSHGSDSNWVATLQNWTKVVHEYHNTSFKVVAPSLTQEASYSQLGDLSAYTDFGNMHNYFITFQPETTGWGGTDQYGGVGSTMWNMNLSKIVSGQNTPIMTTESGFQVMDDPSGSNAHAYVPTDVQAKYIVRLYLYQFGILKMPYTYLYQFIDCGGGTDYSWGLIGVNNENDTNVFARPSYWHIKFLTGLFNDREGTTFTPGNLDYTLSGETNTVISTLFQNSTGAFFLSLWLDQAPWNTNAGGYTGSDPGAYSIVTPQQVTLTVNLKVGTIIQYTLNASGVGTISSSVLSNENLGGASVNLTVTDTVSVIAIVPYSAPVPSTSAGIVTPSSTSTTTATTTTTNSNANSSAHLSTTTSDMIASPASSLVISFVILGMVCLL